MITITLAASLAALIPADEPEGHSAAARSITLDADNWTDAVAELRTRYRRLGEHVFDATGRLRTGFLVALNDEMTSSRPKHLRSGDKMFIFTQIAGG